MRKRKSKNGEGGFADRSKRLRSAGVYAVGADPTDAVDIFYTENDNVAAELVKRCAFCNQTDDSVENGIVTGGWLPYPLIIAKRPSPQPPRMSYIHRNCAAFSSQVYSKCVAPARKLPPLVSSSDGKPLQGIAPQGPGGNTTETGEAGAESSTESLQPDDRDHSVVWYNILREVRRGRCLKCCLCGEKGATMTCNCPRCQATAHVLCAQQTEQSWRPVPMADTEDAWDLWHCDRHFQTIKDERSIEHDFSRGREEWPVTFYSGGKYDGPPASIVLQEASTKDARSFHYITKSFYAQGVSPIRSVRELSCCSCLDCETSEFCPCKYRRLYLPRKGGVLKYQCNSKCRCNVTTCKNRALAALTVHRLALLDGSSSPATAKENNNGEPVQKLWGEHYWIRGVCATSTIPKGAPIAEFVGEIKANDQVEAENSIKDSDDRGHGFVLSLADVFLQEMKDTAAEVSQRGSARPIVTDEADCKDPQLSKHNTQTAEAEKPINFTPAGMHGSISAVICHKDKLGISLCTFNNIDGVYIAEINNDKGEFHRGNVWPGDKLIGVGLRDTEHLSFDRVVQLIRMSQRPLHLFFRKSMKNGPQNQGVDFGNSGPEETSENVSQPIKNMGLWRELAVDEMAENCGSETKAQCVKAFRLTDIRTSLRLRGNWQNNRVEIDELRESVPGGDLKTGKPIIAVGMENVKANMTKSMVQLFSEPPKIEEKNPMPSNLLVQVLTSEKDAAFMNCSLDSRQYGNISRFIRRIKSDDLEAGSVPGPGAVNARICAELAESSYPHVFLRATRTIEPGEEIVYLFTPHTG